MLLHICLTRESAMDVSVTVARKAIRAIGKISLRLPGRANACADKLISLLAMEIGHVTSEALISLAGQLCVMLRYPNTVGVPSVEPLYCRHPCNS